MKSAVAALVLGLSVIGLSVTGPAAAVEYRTPAAKQLFTCGTSGVSRVATREAWAPCCDGQLKCAEFLATTGMTRLMRDPRT